MIIDKTSIPGVYKFKQNTTYEHDDLIYYEGMLYVVTADKYQGELPPNESSQCTSFIDQSLDSDSSGRIVTTKNISGVIDQFIKGVQIGGVLSRIKITSLSQLDDYTHTGMYSVNSANIIQMGAPFEAILRIYRFNVKVQVDNSNLTETRVVQEVVNYGERTDQPTNIWYRVGRIIKGNQEGAQESVSWLSKFSPIVNASNNWQYREALDRLSTSMQNVLSDAQSLKNKYTAASYMHAKGEDEGEDSYFKIPRMATYGRAGFISVVFGYKDDNDDKHYQDSFTCDFSDFVDHANDEILLTSIGGLNIVIKQPRTPDAYYDYIQFFWRQSIGQGEYTDVNLYSFILNVLSIG